MSEKPTHVCPVHGEVRGIYDIVDVPLDSELDVCYEDYFCPICSAPVTPIEEKEDA